MKTKTMPNNVNNDGYKDATQGAKVGKPVQALTQVKAAALIAELERRGGYRVLRHLTPLPLIRCTPIDGLRCAIIVDTETTGLILPGTEGSESAASEVVSLGMVAVAYDPHDGEIKGAIDRFHAYREPARPIPPAATAIHGITDDAVAGHRISEQEVADFIAKSAEVVQGHIVFGSRDLDTLPLIVAHNASYDRKMLEGHFPETFQTLPWACSQSQIPWSEHGYEGNRLFYLAFRAAFYYGERHSALSDADAVVELLRQPLDGRNAMAILHEASRRVSHRLRFVTRYNPQIIAVLKQRGYRWDAGEYGKPKAWCWSGDDAGLVAETEFLGQARFGEFRTITTSDAFDRFSRRA